MVGHIGRVFVRAYNPGLCQCEFDSGSVPVHGFGLASGHQGPLMSEVESPFLPPRDARGGRDEKNGLDGRSGAAKRMVVATILSLTLCSAFAWIAGPWLGFVAVCAVAAFAAWQVYVSDCATLALSAKNRQLEERVSKVVAQQRERETEISRVLRALDQIRDGVAILDDQHRLLWINPSATGMLQISDVPRSMGRWIAETLRYPALTETLEKVAATNENTFFKLEVPSGTGVLPLHGVIESFKLEDGQQNWLLTLHDETETHRTESIRRDIIANLSHELKTPLAAIKGYAETVELAIEDDPDAAEHFLTQIRHQCDRLENLVGSVLQMARAQSGQQKMRLDWLDLGDLVQACTDDMQVLAERKEIEIEFDAGPSLRVHSDREALTTILSNLLSNAIQYTSNGGSVRVGFQRVIEDSRTNPEGEVPPDASQGPGRFLIFVEDNGVGISEEHQKMVFDRFYRVQSARHTGYTRQDSPPVHDPAAPVETNRRGTGIGLSIVKTLTESLGGRVHLRSELGRGSRFEVEFFVDRQSSANPVPPASLRTTPMVEGAP